jgi:twinkle protein
VADPKAEASARLDALIVAKNIGKMLVSQASAQYDADPDVLMEITEQDGSELLASYLAEYARYGTAPFDPKGEAMRFYQGGVTIWSGFPGAGKTTMLRQLVCHCLHRGSSVFLASLEEYPKSLLVMLAATAAGAELPNAHQMQWFIDAYGKRLRLWGKIGIAEHRQILATVRKLAEEGVRHAIIDSLMCLDIANDDFEAQRKFANLLSATARASDVHIHLVAHPRKLISANQEPDINDVAGARELGGIVDNVIFIKRSTDKAKVQAGGHPLEIVIRKQRHGGYLGTVTGWYHPAMRQFSSQQFVESPTRYLPEDAYA